MQLLNKLTNLDPGVINLPNTVTIMADHSKAYLQFSIIGDDQILFEKYGPIKNISYTNGYLILIFTSRKVSIFIPEDQFLESIPKIYDYDLSQSDDDRYVSQEELDARRITEMITSLKTSMLNQLLKHIKITGKGWSHNITIYYDSKKFKFTSCGSYGEIDVS